ncbi:Cysteine synthase [compost metagenome]
MDYVITGVGTGGHITGIASVLKKRFPNIKVLAVEPELSPVLSGGSPGPHPLQGLGAGFIPGIYDTDLIDEVIQVSKEEAFKYARALAKDEGILGGISTGAALAAVALKAETFADNVVVLTFNYDTGERYLSVEGLF